MKTTAWTIRRPLFGLLIAATFAVTYAQVAAIAQTRQSTVASQNYTREDAEIIARRLHMALFNRDQDTGSLNDTIRELEAGRLRPRLEALVATAEFRQNLRSQPAAQQLQQIYQATLNRAPTAAETRRHLGYISQGRYVDIAADIVTSTEFQAMVRAARGNTGGGGGGNTGGGGGGSTATVDTGAALSCQERVVEQVRNDLPGIVLLRFENAQSSSGAIHGVAWDVVDDNRRMTYRCEGGSSSYSYDDGRRDRSAPATGDFPSDRVRACLNEVRNRVQAQRQGDITFESAGLMPTGSGEQVRGLGFESKQGGQNFHYQCQMDGTRVVSASFNWR
jgi:hypothetical protein